MFRGTAGAAVLAAAFAVLPAHAETHRVIIEGMKYSPERLEVKAGDTIVWTNRDVVPHTVTAAASKLESGSIAGTGTWRYVARTPGQIDYVCRFHPGMKATVVVK
jgi:plastocyanin